MSCLRPRPRRAAALHATAATLVCSLIAAANAVAQVRPAQATATVPVRVYVSLSDSSTRFYPVAGHRLFFYRSARDSASVITDAMGSATISLAPGEYRLVSERAVNWHGSGYSWNVPITVRAGMPIIDLRGPDGVQAGAAASSQSEPITQSNNTAASAVSVQPQGDRSAYTRSMVPPKDAGTATLLSVVITGAGQIYAGETGKGVGLLLLDAVGAGIAIGALEAQTTCLASLYDTSCSSSSTDGLMLLGLGTMLGSWIYSIADAGPAVRRYNVEHGYANVTFAPTVTRTGHGNAFGLRLAIRP